MARHVLPKRQKNQDLALQAYAPTAPVPIVPMSVLNQSLTSTKDARRDNRNRFGRSINLNNIENALLAAYRGSMRDLTDLNRETIDTDPHLSSVLMKRFGAVSSLPWDVQPATGQGPDFDKAKAQHFVTVVREQLMHLPDFRKVLAQFAWATWDGRAAQELTWTPIFREPSDFGRVNMALTSIDWVHPRRLDFGAERQMVIRPEGVRTGGNFTTTEGDIQLTEEWLRENKLWRKFGWWNPQLLGEYPEREGLAPRALYYSFFKRYAARERMILAELFAKPWRIIEVDEDSSASAEDLASANEIIDSLGATYTARLPRGVSLRVEPPGATASNVHAEIIEESDKQISKLVLGQTGTTDGVPAGLNSSQANVMQDEQFQILVSDSNALQEVIERYITDAIIEVNFGAENLPFAPRFILRSDLPADRAQELERLTAALEAGLSIKLTEAYEVSGFAMPESDDTTVQIVQPPTPPLAPVSPPPRPGIVHPPNTSPAVGEQQPAIPVASVGEGQKEGAQTPIGSADMAAIVTVNEARESDNLPPLTRPDGELDPDGNLTIEEFKAKKKRSSPDVSEAIVVADPEPVADDDDEPEEIEEVEEAEEIAATAHAETVALIADKFGDYSVSIQLQNSVNQHRIEMDAIKAQTDNGCAHCAREHEQPDTPNGSPERLLDRGKKELWRATKQWAGVFEDAVKGLENPTDIFNALNRAAESIDVDKFGRSLERRMVQSFALGAVDSALEIEESETETETRERERRQGITSTKVQAATIDRNFSDLAFQDAMKDFQRRGLIRKSDFASLSALLKRRAFTVAGVTKDQMLRTIHNELVKQIGAGADLRKFRKFIEERVKTAGFVPVEFAPGSTALSASHVETVFRTNVLNSYNGGRHAHMSQPEVVRAFPIWEFRPIVDNRTRTPHKNVNNKRLFANDPFWQTAYPPYGFNCRCRVVAVSRKLASTVVSGSTIRGLPDVGFTSGVSGLI